MNFIRANIDTALIGSTAFFLLLPFNIINPYNVDWILSFSGISDLVFTWLGWVFFKSTDFFQFPLFHSPNYGFAGGSNIVFSGSIPLLAIIFKPFSNFIPHDFQYFGFWIYLSFILHSYFSKKILEIFTKDKILILLMTILFLTSPVFLHRIYIPHIGLLAQWLLLFSLYLLLRKNFCYKIWFLNLILALLVHGYLFFFCLILFNADLILKNKINLNLDSFKIIYVYSAILLLMFLFGYLSPDSTGPIGGFGYYSMNLNSLINPVGIWATKWSTILPALKIRSHENFYADYEGFNYIGIGVLILLPFVLLKIKHLVSSIENKKKFFVISFMFIIVFLLSVSTHIGLGEKSFVIEIRTDIYTKLSIFRASGRFFWINYYLLYCLVFISIVKFYSRRVGIAIISIAILLHFYDMRESFLMTRDRFKPHPGSNVSQLDLMYDGNIFWKKVALNYKKINILYPSMLPTNENLFKLSYFASKNNMKINSGYFARVELKKLNQEKERLDKIFGTGQLEKDTLYVVDDKAQWISFKQKYNDKLFFKEINDMRLISIKSFN